jgi:beta-lactamase superfamily II metal-dependent hydrolase
MKQMKKGGCLSTIIALIFGTIFLFIGAINQDSTSTIENNTSQVKSSVDTQTSKEVKEEKANIEEVSDVVDNKEVELHFINTGNSDSILIIQDKKAALIDAGDNDDEQRVVSYIKKQGITELEYIFATHPHADHIGGLDAVVDNIKVNNMFVSNGDADTDTYKDFITSMSNKDVNPSVPLLNSEFKLGTSIFKVLSVANKNDPNNDSIVLQYTNGNDKVLLMGDAESEIENSINVGDVDLLKVGHHGSHSSSTESFIDKVNPKYAVILVGKDNKYGHPHVETMELLERKGIEVHRSDECGDIVFKSSGNGLTVDCKEGSYTSGKEMSSDNTNNGNYNVSTNNGDSSSSNDNYGTYGIVESNSEPTSEPGPKPSDNTVYANGGRSTANKYHSSPTAHNMEGAIEMSESDAKAQGYVACKICY